jgi:hypothetical protein
MSDKTGGPAFPRPLSLNVNGIAAWDQEGMSLRDYFAAAALQGIIAANDRTAKFDNPKEILTCYSKTAYAFADAMLAERENFG